MRRLIWPLAVVAAFAVGAAAGGFFKSGAEVRRLRALVERQEFQLSTLQSRVRVREAPGPRDAVSQSAPRRGQEVRVASLPAATTEADPSEQQRGPRRAGGAQRSDLPKDSGSSGSAVPTTPTATPATVQTALDRFYRFLDETTGPGPARWARTREVTADLRSMGDAGIEALMRVLGNGTSADERRAAAQLLGELQAAQALPLLQSILAQDNDVLLRRAAASALRRLETPDAVPALQALLSNPAEDRFVRMSAAFGLAQLGQAEGVTGLTMIFAESTADGRGRDMAFRSLVSLNDERALPFMRQVAGSTVEPGYRLQAIRFLATQGDRQALGMLQQISQTSSEQPSIRDAASQAYATIAGR